MAARTELWKSLATASEEVSEAFSDCAIEQTPHSRARMEQTCRDFIERLRPVVGESAAFEFHAAWQGVIDATDRLSQLCVSLGTQLTIDATDGEMVEQLREALKAAQATLAVAELKIDARMREAAEQDAQLDPSEKEGA